MKQGKTMLVLIIAMSLVITCAFATIPSVRLYGQSEGGAVEVTYLNAKEVDGRLRITVDYDSAGEFFEIGKDIGVAVDSNFKNSLELVKCSEEAGKCVYEYCIEGIDNIDTVYIEPPILYKPAKVNPVSLPVKAGEIAELDVAGLNLKGTNSTWFSVDSVDVIDGEEEGCYIVSIAIDATSEDLPRHPKLCIGDTKYGGTAVLAFDENGNFDAGEFQYLLKAECEEQVISMLESFSLYIEDSLMRVDFKDSVFTSNVKSLSVIKNAVE